MLSEWLGVHRDNRWNPDGVSDGFEYWPVSHWGFDCAIVRRDGNERVPLSHWNNDCSTLVHWIDCSWCRLSFCFRTDDLRQFCRMLVLCDIVFKSISVMSCNTRWWNQRRYRIWRQYGHDCSRSFHDGGSGKQRLQFSQPTGMPWTADQHLLTVWKRYGYGVGGWNRRFRGE
jgi:hypothetical protein